LLDQQADARCLGQGSGRPNSLTIIKIDIVIHTAVSGGSRTKEDDIYTLIDNLSMFNNLVENRNKFGSLIHFGSGAEFDRRTDIVSAKRMMNHALLIIMVYQRRLSKER
jgi:nucleoside-diphosphate-sugar epimerase